MGAGEEGGGGIFWWWCGGEAMKGSVMLQMRGCGVHG